MEKSFALYGNGEKTMSRIGMKPINIPENVEITIDKNNNVSVKGPKGDLTRQFYYCYKK